MRINDQHYNTIWLKEGNDRIIQIIDQRQLPHEFVIEDLTSVEEVATAIKDMHVRGAPLIGITAAYGMYLAAMQASPSNFMAEMDHYAELLKATRPTAVNLSWAVDQQLALLSPGPEQAPSILLNHVNLLKKASIDRCRKIGKYGLPLIQKIYERTQKPVNILTHCNAGWLACIDYGTATAPMYIAHDSGIPIHVWVDETRPRNQGARITAYELSQHGISHTIITDNAGGHLMQHGEVDIVLVGTDRTTATGDVCNKIGTYLKALAAVDNGIPFYVGAPSSSIDWSIEDGLSEIPIELRNENEVKYIQGAHDGAVKKVLLTPDCSPAANYAFDVTPSRLVTGLITERGICEASREGLQSLFS